MKITALKQQVKNPERVSIFVDGKYSFSLSLGELVTERVKSGNELDAPTLKRLQKLSADGKLKARALAWLLNRPHSTREFHDYLRRKKVEPEMTEKLTQEFSGKQYLNDEAYGRWLVELKSRAGKSSRAIRAELFKKGVAREVVEKVLAGDSEDELERLKIIIAKKRRLSRYKNDPARLTKYLTSQGFSYYLVKQQLNIDWPQS